MSEQKFGIENIKTVLGWALSFGQEVSEDLKDKKIKLFEALGFIDNLVDVTKLISAVPQLKDEIADLSIEERSELEAWIQGNYDFTGPVESIIDAAFDFINGATKIIAAFKK